MKISLFLIVLTCMLSTSAVSQDMKDFIKWEIKIEKTKKANEYLVKAQAKLEPDWHIFDLDPGGDGFLIAPDFEFEDKKVEVIKKTAEGKLISTEFAGVDGKVRFYENKVSFNALIRSNAKEIKGSIYYQICDHEKCLAPTEESFDLHIK